MKNLDFKPLYKFLTTELTPSEMAVILDNAILQIVECIAAQGMVPARSELNDIHYLRTLRNALFYSDGNKTFEEQLSQ